MYARNERVRVLIGACMAGLLGVTPVAASPVTVVDAWFRSLPAGLPAGGYFTLHNDGAKDLTLTGAESPACGMLMLHKSDDEGGMSMMTDMTEIDVPANTAVLFAPGGYHLMCTSPTAAMKPGASVPVTFDFADGSKVGANFAVKNAEGN